MPARSLRQLTSVLPLVPRVLVSRNRAQVVAFQSARREQSDRRHQIKAEKERAKKMAKHRNGGRAPSKAAAARAAAAANAVDLTSCEAARAERDVLRMRNRPGDEEAAAMIDAAMSLRLAGRMLSAPAYGSA